MSNAEPPPPSAAAPPPLKGDEPPDNNDYGTLFDALPIGAYRSRPDGVMLRANPALARHELELFDVERGTAFEESLNGLQVRELIGSKLFERLFGPRDPDET